MGAHVIARGVAVFDPPPRRRQDQGHARRDCTAPILIELPFDRINSRCHPTMVPRPWLSRPAECGWRLQVARYAGNAPIVVENSRGFSRDVPPIPKGVTASDPSFPPRGGRPCR